MITGIGMDVCEIARMEQLRTMTRFSERFFTEAEVEYIRTKGRNGAQTMAGMFAAKEAFSKAMGTGLDFDLKEVEIGHDEAGKPEYRFSGALISRTEGEIFHLSISHDGGIAAAFCVRERLL
jgi:holo-[acyl-carrier protein] synthase